MFHSDRFPLRLVPHRHGAGAGYGHGSVQGDQRGAESDERACRSGRGYEHTGLFSAAVCSSFLKGLLLCLPLPQSQWEAV